MKIATAGVSLLAISIGSTCAHSQANVFVQDPSDKTVQRVPTAPIDYAKPINGVVTGDWRDAMPFGGLVRIKYGNNGNRDAGGVLPRLAFFTSSKHSKRALIRAPECTVGPAGAPLPVSRQTNSSGQELWVVDVPPPTNATLRANGADDFEVFCNISVPDCTADEVLATPLISTTDAESNTTDNGKFLTAASPIDQFGVGEPVTVRAPSARHASYSDIPKRSNLYVAQPSGVWPGYDRCRETNTTYQTGANFECYIRLVNNLGSNITRMQLDDWAIQVRNLKPGFSRVSNIPPGGRGFSYGAKFAWSIVSPAISLYPDGYGGFMPLLGAGFHGVDEQARAKIYDRFCKPSGADLCNVPNTPATAFGSFFPSAPKNATVPHSYLEAIELDHAISPNFQSGMPKCLFPGEEIRFRTMVDRAGVSAGNSATPNKMTMELFIKFASVATPYTSNRVYVPPQPMGPWRP